MFLSDSDASAVVLFEKGSVEIVREVIGNYEHYAQIYTVHRVIKILKEDAINEANIQDYYYSNAAIEGKVKYVTGTTYYLKNGTLTKTEMAKSAVFNNRYNDVVYQLKFALPAVGLGSIIDYSYQIYSPASLSFRPWYFQNEYPTLTSEYEISIPRGFPFVTVGQALPTFREFKSKKEAEQSDAQAYIVNVEEYGAGVPNNIIWVRKNISALTQEPYSGNVDDYRERINVQVQPPDYNVSNVDSAGSQKAWKGFTKTLWEYKYFGKQLELGSRFLKGDVDSIMKVHQDDLARAKAIFRYVRSRMHCIDEIAITPHEDMVFVFENKEGNAAEINLLLTEMLCKAGLNASPLVLSTKGRPKATPQFPLLDRFNHAVCLLQIGTARYYLDASGKYNAFGRLPYYCYTGYARVINKDGGYPIDILPKDNKEKDVVMANVISITDTSFIVRISEYLGMNKSRELRTLVKKDSSEFTRQLKAIAQGLHSGAGIDSLSMDFQNNPDTNLKIKYTIVQNFEKPLDVFYLSTDLVKAIPNVPFKTMKRRTPVELDFPEEHVYVFNANLPQNIDAEDIPKSAILDYGEDINFKHMISYDSTTRTLGINTNFKRSGCIYAPREYDDIKEMYEKMYKEITQIVVLKYKK
ncbi:MAG: DUF3857 domain-containing protein [Bacteroidetes bacterium]|nr:DUF3857 domain-containing protein [Bacteroidota bacterium]